MGWASENPTGNLTIGNAKTLQAMLDRLPAYKAALAGRTNLTHSPVGADGLVLPNFRMDEARAAARQNGIVIPSGAYIDPKGAVHAANDAHWYADPKIIGPIAVGAFTGGAALLGAPATTAVAYGPTAGQYAGATTEFVPGAYAVPGSLAAVTPAELAAGVPAAAAGVTPTVGGAPAGGAVPPPSPHVSTIGKFMGQPGASAALIGNGTNAALGIYGMHAQTSAADRAAALQKDASDAQLQFLKDQAAADAKYRAEADAKNLALYNDEKDYTRGLETARRARLQPYVDLGGRAQAQLSTPINAYRGTVGQLLG